MAGGPCYELRMGVERCRVEGDRVTIDGSRCDRCGLAAFPAERYGCERCGAPPESHSTRALGTDGVVIAQATVHRHHHGEPPTPFTVVEVVLEDGPVLKALWHGDGNTGVTPGAGIGQRVTGTVVGDRFAFRTGAAT